MPLGFNPAALCGPSFPEAMSEKSPLSTVSCGCHSTCAASSQAALSLNETLNFQRRQSPQITNASSVTVCFNGAFETFCTEKKRNPLPHASFKATFQSVIRERRRGATLQSSFPCRPRRRAITGDKAGTVQTRALQTHTQNAHHTSVAETTAGRFQSETRDSWKKGESSVTKEQSVGTKPTTQKRSNKLLLSFEKRDMKLSFL